MAENNENLLTTPEEPIGSAERLLDAPTAQLFGVSPSTGDPWHGGYSTESEDMGGT